MTQKNKRTFQQQTITDTEPGTLLRDFQTLLDFIGPEGLRSAGKQRLLPMAKLADLDERMTHPLRPNKKRPQQFSYPHIHGLILLLRASGLATTESAGKAGRIRIDPQILEQWQTLNPTERYFNLLEAFLFRASAEMIGEQQGLFGGPSGQTFTVMQGLCKVRGEITGKDVLHRLGLWQVKQYYILALMELFGWVTVDRDEPAAGENWHVTAVRTTPFGDAITDFIEENLSDIIHRIGLVVEPQEDDAVPVLRFGHWQPKLQPYFPEWQNNLIMPPLEFREGLFEFKAALRPSLWRRIVISSGLTLEDLAWAIIGAYDFDGDHLYQFAFRAPDMTTVIADCTIEGDYRTDEVPIGSLPLCEGDSMTFVYDFGAWWKFEVTLEKVGPLDPDQAEARPQVVAQKGKAPPEYDYE